MTAIITEIQQKNKERIMEKRTNYRASYEAIQYWLVKYRDAFLKEENERRQKLGKKELTEYKDMLLRTQGEKHENA